MAATKAPTTQATMALHDERVGLTAEGYVCDGTRGTTEGGGWFEAWRPNVEKSLLYVIAMANGAVTVSKAYGEVA